MTKSRRDGGDVRRKGDILMEERLKSDQGKERGR